MTKRKPLVVVTRKLPEVVETRMMELFNTRLNASDTPMGRAELGEAVKTAEVLVPTVTDRIDRLYERLEQAKREFPVLHPDQQFAGDIVFQIDRRVPWNVIKTVARTCAQVGYVRLNFAVTKGNANQGDD